MKLSAPKNITFYIAVLLALVGLIGFVAKIGFLVDYGIWLVLVGFIVLALGNLLEGF